MKTMRSFLLLGVVLSVAGCSTPFRPWNLSDVHEGMSRDQVAQVLGVPDFTEVKDGAEQWHYIYQEDFTPSLSAEPFYDTNTERAFRELTSERVFKQYEYVVILVDGKMINYKEL